MSVLIRRDLPSAKRNKGPTLVTCKPFVPGTRKKFYFTTGRQVSEDDFQNMNATIARSFQIPKELDTQEAVDRFWESVKIQKEKERKGSYVNKHTHRSRSNLLWKMERLFVEDVTKLPGKSVTDHVDPDFFKITQNRPINQKKNVRQYIQDVRNCFLARLETGFHQDEVLLMEERYLNEKKKLHQVRENFATVLKGFETFLEEDHVSSTKLLKKAKEETQKSNDKLKVIDGLRKELKNVQADVLVVEEKWRSCQMFQKFLYIIAPSEWRKTFDPDFGKKDVDANVFDRFREFPGDTRTDLEGKISKFKEDVKQRQAPTLFFTDPRQLQDILADLEKNNQVALLHCKELDRPAENMTTEVEKAKIQFQQDQKNLEEEISFLTDRVIAEEKKSNGKKEKLKELAFGLFRDLVINEEYLSVTSYVEDAYEYAVAPNDDNLGLVEMIKEIELKHEELLLTLDSLPNDVVLNTTRRFYEERKRELKEARKAEKKVHQMEILLKRLSKSLEKPKKGSKERKIVRRSSPPEELMYEYVPPKTLSKEEKDYLFFFGETSKGAGFYKPLCT